MRFASLVLLLAVTSPSFADEAQQPFLDRLLYPNSPQPEATPAAAPSPEPAGEPERELGPPPQAGTVDRAGYEKPDGFVGETRERRGQTKWFGIATYSPIDLVIPSKVGATLGLVQGASNTLELEFLRGKLGSSLLGEDLGSFIDDRFSLIRRSYFGNNSFNLSYGASYYHMQVNLGSDVLARSYPGSIPPNATYLDTKAVGLNIGIGNRWIIGDNFVIGCDWLSWSQPVAVLSKQNAFVTSSSSAQDRKNADDFVTLMSFFPRLTFLKFQIGMTF